MKNKTIPLKRLSFIIIAGLLLLYSCEKEEEYTLPKGLTISIEGDAVLGDTLTLNLPEEINRNKVSLQWIRYPDSEGSGFDTRIPGANEISYVVTLEDVGSYLTVEISNNERYDQMYSRFTEEVSCLKGKGTEANPYKIYYIEDLAYLAARFQFFNYYSEYPDYYFSLERDLDFNADTSYRDPDDTSLDWDDNDDTSKGIMEAFTTGEGFIPMHVKGTFKGNNHTISGLYCNTRGAAGLFEEIYSINNLRLQDVNLTGGYAVGGLATSPGLLTNIENCFVSGTLTVINEYYAGGLVGKIDPFNVNSITLINNEVDIQISDATANLDQSILLGGLAGYIDIQDNTEIIIENNAVKGQVISKTYKAGGLIGRVNTSDAASFKIMKNYCSATVEGRSSSSGFIGDVTAWFGGTFFITDNYSTGVVKSAENATNCKLSGFIGFVNIVESYATINIGNNYTTSDLEGNETSIAGGIVGYFETTSTTYSFNITNCIAFTSSITGSGSNCNRILGSAESNTYPYLSLSIHYNNNYANSAMVINENLIEESETEPENDINGKSLSESNFGNLSFYSNPDNWNTAIGLMWDFNNIWEMNYEKGRPALRNNEEN
ncbi:MAG: hypothetical protein V2I54_11280 [Bacteroidales bacterium]|jgi:hypothetical protein|nr:hypothetical protein [Bacteroidales bacterium]